MHGKHPQVVKSYIVKYGPFAMIAALEDEVRRPIDL